MEREASRDESLPAWFCDPVSRIVLSANPAAGRLLGRDSMELRGAALAGLLSPGQPAALLERAFPPLDDPVFAGRWRLRRNGGADVEVDIASSPADRDGRRIRVLFALDPRREGAEADRVLADLLRRAQQHTMLLSLARESASSGGTLKQLLGRMLTAAELTLEGQRLELLLAQGGAAERIGAQEEAGALGGAWLDLALPLGGAGRALLRCSRTDGRAVWSDEDRRFLGAVASLLAVAVERHAPRPAGPSARPDEARSDWTSERIREALREAGGNRTAAAKRLGMSRVTLWKRLKGLGEA